MIHMRNISHSYWDGMRQIQTLAGVDLEIAQGEWVALTGANGSGKSTLLRLCNGLVMPTSGSLTVAGLDLLDPEQRDLVKQKVQMVFQNPDAQITGAIVAEDVAFGLESRGIPREEMLTRIDRTTRQVGLGNKLFAEVSTLSGGQKQRLAIASGLVLEPQCLLFDEATAMLDPVGRKEILSRAHDLWKSGVTVVWVTQRLQELLEAPRILFMERGQITFDGDARTLFYDTDIPERAGWDVPAVVKIGRWLKQQGVPMQNLPLKEREVADLLCECSFVM
ncbi:ATP-binding cassette domain-containing protein [Effusibacillus lacus]|uniref:ABC transporter domain-containing protein n=1 Tax=Effusibacillus lacus TaxID=1348429 RepID=A0A292YKP3_9BACL|nr:ATP-binding cassette domain-containing protein [Effusibacillus lacus]TCS75489.1 energy-coupling factor transport system ATP-binding protein [Effusibacillus lacus]GAX88954.1 hypothetical protein EFBL_0568 [Effusibacillus lacus]